MAPAELHIASLVVHAVPRQRLKVAETITALPEAMVHAVTDNGKLVVTLEAASAQAMSARVSSLQQVKGVLSAALVYQCSDSLDAMNEEVSDAPA